MLPSEDSFWSELYFMSEGYSNNFHSTILSQLIEKDKYRKSFQPASSQRSLINRQLFICFLFFFLEIGPLVAHKLHQQCKSNLTFKEI